MTSIQQHAKLFKRQYNNTLRIMNMYASILKLIRTEPMQPIEVLRDRTGVIRYRSNCYVCRDVGSKGPLIISTTHPIIAIMLHLNATVDRCIFTSTVLCNCTHKEKKQAEALLPSHHICNQPEVDLRAECQIVLILT